MNHKATAQPTSTDGRSSQYEYGVFVSYAWGGESERIVDALDRAFAAGGIHLKRDKKDLNYRGSIQEFEKRIGNGQCVALVISDKYLRSQHCMNELVELEHNQELRQRAFPIVLTDACIYQVVDRLTYIKYWDGEIEKLNQAIKEVKVVANLKNVMTTLDQYTRIRASFDHLTDLLSDMNALTADAHENSNFAVLVNSVKRALASGQAGRQTSSAIEYTGVQISDSASLNRPEPLNHDSRILVYLTIMALVLICVAIGYFLIFFRWGGESILNSATISPGIIVAVGIVVAAINGVAVNILSNQLSENIKHLPPLVRTGLPLAAAFLTLALSVLIALIKF